LEAIPKTVKKNKEFAEIDKNALSWQHYRTLSSPMKRLEFVLREIWRSEGRKQRAMQLHAESALFVLE